MIGAPLLTPFATALLSSALALTGQRPALDASHAFFHADRTPSDSTIVATSRVGDLDRGTYQRYLAGLRPTSQRLAALGFDFLLARECEERGLARSAPTLALATSSRRLLTSGRTSARSPQPSLRARFATEALRQLRVAALVGAQRRADPAAIRELFDHRYGQDGVRVRLRHVFISVATARAEAPLDRARRLHARIATGATFDELLRESDDRATRTALRNPATAATAGVLPKYNYRRFGPDFADAVRGLAVGEVSAPVASPRGYHLIELLERRVTRLADVRTGLAKEVAGGRVTQPELDALQRELFAKFEFRLVNDQGPERTQDPTRKSTTDWPHYRGDPGLAGRAAGSLGDVPELAWSFATAGEILSSPIVVDGIVYVGSTDNSVYALDLQTGEKRWSFATGDMVEAPALHLAGNIYIGSSDGFFYALDAATGQLRWRFETKDRILGGANWFRTKAGELHVVVGSYDASVYCLDTAGKSQWSYETDNYVHGAPAVGKGEIVFGGCDAGLHLVDAETGKRITKIDLGQGCQVAGSVALVDDRAYFGHYGNEFLRVQLESGEVEWTYKNRRQGFVSSPALDDEHVVVGSRDKQLHCMSRKDGKPLWKFKTRRKVDGSPVICGDKVVFGSGDGRLYMLRLATGELVWSYDIGKPVFSSPAVSNGMIVVGANDKKIWAFRAHPARDSVKAPAKDK
ncbi:MAG: PQQ-binding-like beta-propeller repeat protein [bacterium]|nr:PQQ-binding-like beta-propeller repeat protein [bacterium]